jgi:short-subunit dehydrogenase
MKQTILITGASSGFGLLIANKLYEIGYNVIGTSRNPEKIQPSLPFKVIALDIADDDSIRSFETELFKHTGRVDVLINNAGFYLSGLAEETSIELGKQQFETNFWGTIKVTNSLLPHFRKQRSGRIITVGSIAGLLNFPSSAYYGASKHALEGYFKSLRFELNEFNVKIAMIEPMGFKTNIIGSSIAADRKIEDYSAYRKKIAAFAADLFDNAPEPTPVIKTVLKLVEAKEPKFNHTVGKGANVLLGLQHYAYKTFEKAMIKNINKFQS